MTIGIGVLCSTEGKRTDALVMISDSMGSTETDSTNVLGKMYTMGSVHAVAAGSMAVASEMFYTIANQIENIPPGTRRHGTLWQSLNVAVNGIRTEKFKWEVLRNQHVIENEIMGRIFEDDPAKIQEAWRTYHIGADLLVGTFDDDGQAFLYYVGPIGGVHGFVHLFQFPGHCAIGTGGPNASMWLNHRGQAINLGVKRSLYHAYEASRMAASSPTVNKEIEITIATKDNHSYFAKDRSYPGAYSVSFAELDNLYQKYGPQSTDGIE